MGLNLILTYLFRTMGDDMEIKGALTMSNPKTAISAATEDIRYYILCRKRKNQARIPISRCFDCEYVTGYVDGPQIGLGCGFPMRQKRPQVKRISRDAI